ncbi:MAG: recombinase family protein [Bacteroidales bacterium]|nr:recombinase family protein [Bacteroidales bacterium]
MKKSVAYLRVSSTTDRQNTDRQRADIEEYANRNGYEVLEYYSEKISGAKKNTERPIFSACLERAEQEGATIIISELSRQGRDVWEVLESVKYCVDRKINVIYLKENISLFDAEGNVSLITPLLISALGISAQVERDNIKYRLNSGKENAIKRGVKMGRKKGSVKTEETKKEQYGEVIKLLKKGLSVADIANICKGKGIKCSTSTIKRLKHEFNL